MSTRSEGYDRQPYPSLTHVNQTFNAVTSYMYKRPDKRFHPLLELAVLLNQLIGVTYFNDLTLLGHLVALSLNKDASTLRNESWPALRARLMNLENLRDIFFSWGRNWFSFVKQTRRLKDNMTTLSHAIKYLEDYVAGCQQVSEGQVVVDLKRKRGYEAIKEMTKHKANSAIIMQIVYCKGYLSDIPDQPATVQEIIATSYQVLKELRVTAPNGTVATSLYFSGLANFDKLQFVAKSGGKDTR